MVCKAASMLFQAPKSPPAVVMNTLSLQGQESAAKGYSLVCQKRGICKYIWVSSGPGQAIPGILTAKVDGRNASLIGNVIYREF